MVNFYVDKQVQVTAREFHQIYEKDAVDFESRIKRLVESGADTDAIAREFNSYVSTEFLKDTANDISVEDNLGYATIEVYKQNLTDCIAANGER